MLMAKPWKLEALMRLVFSVFVCYLAGILITLAIPVISSGQATRKFIALDALGLICLTTAFALIRKRSTGGDVGRRVIVAFICAYAGMLLGLWGQHVVGAGSTKAVLSTGQMLVALASFQGALLLLIPGFLREHDLGPVEAFGFSKRAGIALAWGVLAGSIFFQIGMELQKATAWLMENNHFFSMKPTEQDAVHTIRTAPSVLGRIALSAGTILLAPSAEEILFRGILYSWIKSHGFRQLAFWGTSLLFAVVHFNIQGAPTLFVLALILALLYEGTGNLIAPIAAHGVFNALNLVALYRIQTQMEQIPY